jgi:hypothetical protein
VEEEEEEEMKFLPKPAYWAWITALT